LTNDQIEEKIEILNLKDSKKRIAVSAKTGYNIDELKNMIKDNIQSQKSFEFKKDIPKEFDNSFGN